MKKIDRLLGEILRNARENLPAPADTPPPFGFSTRVAARWAAVAPRASSTLPTWERFLRRAAGGLAITAIVVAVSVWRGWVPVESAHDIVLETQLLEMLPLP